MSATYRTSILDVICIVLFAAVLGLSFSVVVRNAARDACDAELRADTTTADSLHTMLRRGGPCRFEKSPPTDSDAARQEGRE